MDSCEGNIYGDVCQADTSICTCTLDAFEEYPWHTGHTCNTTMDAFQCGDTPSCIGQMTGEFCDASKGECKCSEYVDACQYPETCYQGVCYCGLDPSCVGEETGSYCDGNKCKCAPDVDACIDKPNGVCVNGACGKLFGKIRLDTLEQNYSTLNVCELYC